MSDSAPISSTRPVDPELDAAWTRDCVFGRAPRFRHLVEHLRRVGEVQCTALISGETGTGKELLAALVHRVGPRRRCPFVPVNCAAISPSLAESQLFGHERGAFTGAAGAALGVFRAAQGGIVFLDEIGEMPLELQPKLLRVLQEREVTPVGTSRPAPIDVQVIAATNRNLAEEVQAGRFREDLYYRLNLVELRVPPLRERVEDIPEFIEFFSQRFAKQYARPVWRPNADTVRQFCEFPWPGNIRQLSQVIEQSYVLDSQPELPGTSRTQPASTALDSLNLDVLRRKAVLQALHITQGNKGRAARLLGVHANTLTRLIRQLDLIANGSPVEAPV